MDSRTALRQILRAPHAYRTFLTTSTRPQTRSFALLSPSSVQPQRHLSVPRILQPSFWTSIIPQPFRARATSSPRRGWNPATPYIILALLVGSQAVQMLWLKQERGHYMRRAEAKIGLLKEVIEKVQRGENVDVGKLLGAGDAAEEAEWAQVLKEIEEEERLFAPKKSRISAKKAASEPVAAEQQSSGDGDKADTKQEGQVHVEVVDGAKFY